MPPNGGIFNEKQGDGSLASACDRGDGSCVAFSCDKGDGLTLPKNCGHQETQITVQNALCHDKASFFIFNGAT